MEPVEESEQVLSECDKRHVFFSHPLSTRHTKDTCECMSLFSLVCLSRPMTQPKHVASSSIIYSSAFQITTQWELTIQRIGFTIQTIHSSNMAVRNLLPNSDSQLSKYHHDHPPASQPGWVDHPYQGHVKASPGNWMLGLKRTLCIPKNINILI